MPLLIIKKIKSIICIDFHFFKEKKFFIHSMVSDVDSNFKKQIHWENATARAIILESVYWFYFTCISKWRLIISASLGVFNEILM